MTTRGTHLLLALALGGALCALPARSAELREVRALADSGRTEKALRRLDRAFPPGITAGTRYPARQMGNMGL